MPIVRPFLQSDGACWPKHASCIGSVFLHTSIWYVACSSRKRVTSSCLMIGSRWCYVFLQGRSDCFKIPFLDF